MLHLAHITLDSTISFYTMTHCATEEAEQCTPEQANVSYAARLVMYTTLATVMLYIKSVVTCLASTRLQS
jgi:hypothetical protein